MHIKTTIRYHHTKQLTEWLSSINQQKALARMWRKGNAFALLVIMQTGAAITESRMVIPQKIKNGPAFRLSNPTSGNISKGTQNINSKEHTHPCVHSSIIYYHEDMQAAQVSISR